MLLSGGFDKLKSILLYRDSLQVQYIAKGCVPPMTQMSGLSRVWWVRGGAPDESVRPRNYNINEVIQLTLLLNS